MGSPWQPRTSKLAPPCWGRAQGCLGLFPDHSSPVVPPLKWVPCQVPACAFHQIILILSACHCPAFPYEKICNHYLVTLFWEAFNHISLTLIRNRVHTTFSSIYQKVALGEGKDMNDQKQKWENKKFMIQEKELFPKWLVGELEGTKDIYKEYF